MDSIIVIINALLYCALFIYTWSKNRKIGTSEALLSIYVVVSIACVFNYFSDPDKWRLSIFNLTYLFLVFCIFIKPLMRDSVIEVSQNPLKAPSLYKKIAIGYIVIAFYSCIVYIPQVYLVLQNPEWADLYAEAHEEVTGNIYTKIANLFFHFRYLGLVLFFVFLAQKNTSKLFVLLLGIASFLPVVLVTIMNASRGGIIALVVSIFLIFCMFEKVLNPKIKSMLKRIAFCIVPLVIIYFLAVTVSRFEDNAGTGYESSEDALLSYLGHSMLTFDYGVMDSIEGYANGGYMFGDEQKLKGLRGGHFGSSFVTFIGNLYLDYGGFGTFIFAIIAAVIMSRFIKKRSRGIPEIFIILYYLMYLFNGVFVLGVGYGIQWLETIFVYIILKILEKIRTSNICVNT